MRLFVLAKPLDQAKGRLAGALDADARAQLAEAMLADLLVQARAARTLNGVAVLTADPRLARLARDLGAEAVFEGEPRGLNAAAALALAEARARGDRAVMILPADLPWLRAADIDDLARSWRPGATAAAPATDGGTNGLVLDTRLDWDFRFGPGSFAAHMAVARDLGAPFLTLARDALAFDLDDAAALARACDPRALPRLGPQTRAALSDPQTTRRRA